jgi:hypothetical protein
MPGAPMTYLTSRGFLGLYGLASLNELPDFEALQADAALARAPASEEIRERLAYGEAFYGASSGQD